MKKFTSVLAVAAVLVNLCGCGIVNAPSANQPAGSFMPDGSKHVEYTGAILPLTIRESCVGLTAQRTLQLDFSEWEADKGVAVVKDDYVLSNSGNGSIDVNLYYPIASCLNEWQEEGCRVAVNEIPTKYEVYYARPDSNESGRFEIYDDQYDDPYDIGESLAWYMEHTYCLERAFEPMADLSQIMAYRYRIVDVQYDSVWPMPKEASLCLSYNWDVGQGILRGYGFTRSGGDISIPGTEFRREMVLEKDVENAFLMSMNGKLTDYSLSGYSSERCEEGTELPELTARLEVEELPLLQIMEEAIEHYIEHNPVEMNKQLFSKEVINRIAGDLSQENGGDGYNSLLYYLNIIPNQERIFWLEIPFTIGAGEEIVVSIQHERAGGAEIGGPAAREGVWHYDILPNYGTNLSFDSQFISVTGSEKIEITKRSLGSKLDEGFVPDEEFYHFAVEGASVSSSGQSSSTAEGAVDRITEIDLEETYPEVPATLEVVYNDVLSIIGDAEVVMKGDAIKQEVISLDGYPQTHTTMDVTTVLKGNIEPGSSIVVIEEGGKDGRLIAGIPQISPDYNYYLMLIEHEGAYYVCGAFQGRFVEREGYVFQQATEDVKLAGSYAPMRSEEFECMLWEYINADCK